MGLGISSVSIPEISPYTKSEQPRIAGKHLTRHAKNGYAVVANIVTLRSRASLFFEGRRPLPGSLDIVKQTNILLSTGVNPDCTPRNKIIYLYTTLNTKL